MTTIFFIASIILLILGLLAIFGSFGYVVFTSYRSIDGLVSPNFAVSDKAFGSILKTSIAAIACVTLGAVIFITGIAMMVIAMSFAV